MVELTHFPVEVRNKLRKRVRRAVRNNLISVPEHFRDKTDGRSVVRRQIRNVDVGATFLSALVLLDDEVYSVERAVGAKSWELVDRA